MGLCSLAHGGIRRHCGEPRRSGVRYCDVGSSQGRGLRHGRSGVLDSNVGYVPRLDRGDRHRRHTGGASLRLSEPSNSGNKPSEPALSECPGSKNVDSDVAVPCGSVSVAPPLRITQWCNVRQPFYDNRCSSRPGAAVGLITGVTTTTTCTRSSFGGFDGLGASKGVTPTTLGGHVNIVPTEIRIRPCGPWAPPLPPLRPTGTALVYVGTC